MAVASWTILVFLNAKNDLERFAFPNFDQMASIGGTGDVNLIVEMGRPRHHYTEAHGAWSKTLRFEIRRGSKPEEADAIADLGATNMGDAKSLADFVAWGRASYPAKRTMLVIWNHGQGWRVGDPRPPGAPPPPAAPQIAGGHRYVSNDDDTGDKLYNRAIQDELGALLEDERLDVIAFDACLMAMIETAYALRNVAGVMVGSEELEPGTGWNYSRWLQPLVDARGDVDAEELGRLMVKGMQEEYADLDDTTLSAIATAEVPALAKAVSDFADTAIPQLTAANLNAFRAARAACANYAPGYGLHSIDLGRYMEQIVNTPLDANVRDRARDVLTCLQKAVLSNYASRTRRGKFGSNGLAIYYPLSAAAYAADIDSVGYAADNKTFPVEFVEKEHWARFLHEYWKLVP